MAEEEQPVQRLIETFEQLKEALPPGKEHRRREMEARR